VQEVAQGYIASQEEPQFFSEGVLVSFDPEIIPLEILIAIHLQTHKSSSNHSMRTKYKSAIYTFSDRQKIAALQSLEAFQKTADIEIITEVVSFDQFKASRPEIQNYYYTNPEKPFCQLYIDPKIELLIAQFSDRLDHKKINHLLEKNEKY
jgi:peptide-methionine (S)-S-oxide reductase